MTAIVQAEFMAGETLQLALAATSGDPSAATGLSAAVKKAGAGLTVPPPATPVALTFTVTARAAAGGVAAGFDLVAVGTLAPGIYCTNVQGILGGKTFKSDALFFRVKPSPTT